MEGELVVTTLFLESFLVDLLRPSRETIRAYRCHILRGSCAPKPHGVIPILQCFGSGSKTKVAQLGSWIR